MPLPFIHLEAAEPQTLNEIREWHQNMLDALGEQRTSILQALHAGTHVSLRFTGLTEADVESYYDRQLRELDRLTILNLVASAEAAITLDYFHRIKTKSKDALARHYRKWYAGLSAKKQLRPDFDEHGILALIKKSHVMDNHIVGQYRECLKVRHWVGHGRYWTKPDEVDDLDPNIVYQRSEKLLRSMPA